MGVTISKILSKEVLSRFHLINDPHEADFSLVPAKLGNEEVAVLCWIDNEEHRPIGVILSDIQIEELQFPDATLIKE